MLNHWPQLWIPGLPVSSTQKPGRRHVRSEPRSKEVLKVEREAKALGAPVGPVDGYLDARTTRGLKLLRAELGLKPKRGQSTLDRPLEQALSQAASGTHRHSQLAVSQSATLLGGRRRAGDGSAQQVTREGRAVDDADDTDPTSKRHQSALLQLRQNTRLEQSVVAALPSAERTQYRQVKRELLQRNDTPAALALQQLLFKKKLQAPDLVGQGTLLSHLSRLATNAPLAEPKDRRQVLSDVVQEIAQPHTIDQGAVGSCAPTSLAIDLAQRAPAEYARLAVGVASPAGTVTLAGGLPITRPPGTERDDGTGRSTVQRMLGSALYDVSNGDAPYTGGVGVGSDTVHSSLLASQLFGKQLKGAAVKSGDELSRSRLMQVIGTQLAAGQHVSVGLSWEGGNHRVLVTRAADGSIEFVNPWGREERMSLSEFQSRLVELTYDPSVLSPELQNAALAYEPKLTRVAARRLQHVVG